MFKAEASNLDFEVKNTKGIVTFHLKFAESEIEKTAALYAIKPAELVYMFMLHENREDQVYVGQVRLYNVERLESGEQVVHARGEKKDTVVAELAAIPEETTFMVIVFTKTQMAEEAQRRIQQNPSFYEV